jgi:hypothetical protein
VIPIFEQGDGKGIGHDQASFIRRFDEICTEHLQEKRAKAFAFIFYDFANNEFREILRNQGVFAKLDRLAGTQLSIFYLSTYSRRMIEKFNSTFLNKLKVKGEAHPPCIVFFKINKEGIGDIAVAELDNTDLIHGFHELYEVIEHYIETDLNKSAPELRSLKWIKSGGAFISLEAFKAALGKAIEHILF